MFANTITLTINTVAKVLTRINQDGFGSVYRLTTATERITLQFRNSTETPKDGSGAIDRHNMFVERIVFATPTTKELYSSFSATLRGRLGTDPADVGYLASAASAVLASNQGGLLQGES